MSFSKHLKALFGGSKPAPKKKSVAKSAKTYVTSTTDRAKVLADALAIHRRARGQMNANLDAKLAALREEAPKVLRDPAAMARLLSLYRAHVDMRRMMASDNRRFLVLSGMRELLGDTPAVAGPRKKSSKP